MIKINAIHILQATAGMPRAYSHVYMTREHYDKLVSLGRKLPDNYEICTDLSYVHYESEKTVIVNAKKEFGRSSTYITDVIYLAVCTEDESEELNNA